FCGNFAEDTDAWGVFDGVVNVDGGVINLADSAAEFAMTFDGLDPGRTYTLVATANRAGGTGSDYLERETVFTLEGADDSVDHSSAGADFDGAAVTFVTGENTDTGFVAAWGS